MPSGRHGARLSKLESQRQRRAMYPRIDYYPCKEMLALIRERAHGRVGGDHSSVINALVLATYRNKVRRLTGEAGP